MAAYNLSALAILIADKNLNMRRLLRGILRELNIRLVTEADTPEAALALLTVKPFDIAFIEWAPDFDGTAAIHKLRRDPKALSRYIPMIVNSAYSEVQNVIAARDNGATQFLVKPFTAKMIYSHLQAAVETQLSFIQTKIFVGPDRRRKKKPAPDGAERRGVRPKVDAAISVSPSP